MGLANLPHPLQPVAAATASPHSLGARAYQLLHWMAAREELPKNFEISTSEERIYKWWEECGYFLPDENATGAPFTISMPPPNVTGRLHMGHAMFATLQDVMVRYARMSGRKTLWLPGTDHAGIATQNVVEKALALEGITRQQLGREAFVDRVWQWKREYGGFITNQLRRLGASCDWSRERFTLDQGLSSSVAEAFVQLYEKGLIYRGSYMVNWAPKLGTAVSDLEVDYTEESGFMYYFKYPIEGDDNLHLPVATTRPRYMHLIGRMAVVPCSGRLIPIIADTYVDMEFGTGALKITPGHDINDYEIGKRVGLPTINIMNKDATLNAAAGKYEGLERFKARKVVWADMEAAGITIKRDPHTMRVPRSQRGGEVIEPLVSEQWFVRMEPLAGPALQAAADGRVKFVPERFEKTYNFWLENIKDWCISRQLWWGHRIPVWYVFDNEEAAVASEDGRSDRLLVARTTADARVMADDKYGKDCVLRQEEDVLDTWFSSGLWPFSTLGWPSTTAADLQQFYPTQVMETGHDILFFWVARMIMMGLHFTGASPFHTVYLHGLVRDDKGRKMSKSLGNVVDPLTVLEEFGTDALRFTMATGTAAGQDLNLSMERITANRNFTNKLWNAGKFVIFQLDKAPESEWEQLRGVDYSSAETMASLPLAEKWIVSLLHQVIDDVTERHDKYDFNQAGMSVYNFFWDEFADWFIEASKVRDVSSPAGAVSRATLVYVYERVLRLLHPFMPYVTEELWQAIPHQDTFPPLLNFTFDRSHQISLLSQVTLSSSPPWPAKSSPVDAEAVAGFELVKSVVRAVRNARVEYNVEVANKVTATLMVSDSKAEAVLREELPVICLLARLDPLTTTVITTLPTSRTAAAPEHPSSSSAAEPAPSTSAASASVSLVISDSVSIAIPMAGLFDVGKELTRLGRQRTKLQKDLAGVAGKLSNSSFMARASAESVQEAQAAAADVGDKLAAVDARIAEVSLLQA
ncbi:MAG: hypothetical protein WDW38_002779 [Sanguina aurantia]